MCNNCICQKSKPIFVIRIPFTDPQNTVNIVKMFRESHIFTELSSQYFVFFTDTYNQDKELGFEMYSPELIDPITLEELEKKCNLVLNNKVDSDE